MLCFLLKKDSTSMAIKCKLSDIIKRILHLWSFHLKFMKLAVGRPLWLSDACLTGDQKVTGSIPSGSWQHPFVEIDHEIFSMIILSIPLIQEGQLSVSGKRMCTNTG